MRRITLTCCVTLIDVGGGNTVTVTPPCPCLRRMGDYTHRQHPSTPTWLSYEHLPLQWRVVTLEQQRMCEMSFKNVLSHSPVESSSFHVERRGAPPFAFVIANRLWVLILSIPTAASPLCSSQPAQVGKSSALPPDYCSCATVGQHSRIPPPPGFKLGGKWGMMSRQPQRKSRISSSVFQNKEKLVVLK